MLLTTGPFLQSLKTLSVRPLTDFEIIFVQGKKQCWVLLFCEWIPSLPSIICWRRCVLSNVHFCHLVKYQMAVALHVCFCVFSSLPLAYKCAFHQYHVVSAIMTTSIIWYQALWYPHYFSFLLRTSLAILWRISLELWCKLLLIFGLLLVIELFS